MSIHKSYQTVLLSIALVMMAELFSLVGKLSVNIIEQSHFFVQLSVDVYDDNGHSSDFSFILKRETSTKLFFHCIKYLLSSIVKK